MYLIIGFTLCTIILMIGSGLVLMILDLQQENHKLKRAYYRLKKQFSQKE